MYFYLWNGSSLDTPFVIEDEANNINFGQTERFYDALETFSDNTIISGIGNLKPRSFDFDLIYTAGTDETAWNSKRSTLLKMMALPKWEELFLYSKDTDNLVRRARIYPKGISNESYDNLRISNSINYSFLMETAYFEAVNESSVTINIADTNESSTTLTISGETAVSPVITFTTATAFNEFSLKLGSGYGFILDSNFSSGDIIEIDCRTGIIQVNAIEVSGIMTFGSFFKLQVGDNKIYIIADVCEVVINYYERYL